jgi:hypothetical protein
MAPWDSLVKGVTVGTLILLVSLVVVFTFVADGILLTAGFIVLFSSTILLPFLWAPRGYTIQGDMVLVKRLIGNARIHVAERPKRWNWTWWRIKLIGSGGLYGYYGYFFFRGLGKASMYATNRHNLVLIRDSEGRNHLVSPNNPEKLMQQLE